jgi:uncharacterized protein
MRQRISVHYLLFYEVGEDYISRRAAFRQAHLEKAWKASERVELLLGGAFANSVDGAVLLFQGNSPKVAEKFAKPDPCVTGGAVKRWYVREWTTVVGKDAATPVRPNVSSAAKTVEFMKEVVRPHKGNHDPANVVSTNDGGKS